MTFWYRWLAVECIDFSTSILGPSFYACQGVFAGMHPVQIQRWVYHLVLPFFIAAINTYTMWIQSIPSHWHKKLPEMRAEGKHPPKTNMERFQKCLSLSALLSLRHSTYHTSLSLSMYIYIYLPHTSPYYFWGHRSWLFPPVQLHPQATEASQKAADPVLLGLVLYACQGWRSNHLCPLVSKLEWSWMV